MSELDDLRKVESAARDLLEECNVLVFGSPPSLAVLARLSSTLFVAHKNRNPPTNPKGNDDRKSSIPPASVFEQPMREIVDVISKSGS